ncbi:MAG: cysteine--tRNA ligase, partial [Nitrospinales bacterium]
EAGGILGLFYMKPGDFKNLRLNKKIAELSLDPAKIESIIAERNKARAAKDWKKADECRDELAELNVVLEDTATGTVWKVK